MKHNNPTISEDFNRIFNVKGDSTSYVANYIQPTKEIMRRCNIVKNVTKTATGNSTVYTVPSDKDFYLVAYTHALSTDAANSGTNGLLTVVIEGLTINLDVITRITLTAINSISTMSLPVPVKLDRGSSILITHTYGAGAGNHAASIMGYTEEVTKGV